jgi:hypothetical protein
MHYPDMMPNMAKPKKPDLSAIPYDVLKAELDRRDAANPKTGRKPNYEPIHFTPLGRVAQLSGHSGLRGKRHDLFMALKDGMTVADFQTAAAPMLKTPRTRARMPELRARVVIVLRVLIECGLIVVKGMTGKK